MPPLLPHTAACESGVMDAVVITQNLDLHSHEDKSDDKKRKHVCKAVTVLSTVVDIGGNMSGTEIMKRTGASRSIAFAVVKKAKNYPNGSEELNKMPRVRNQKLVLATITSLLHHLVDFPYVDMVSRFCDNARCDVEESLLPDKDEAAVRRKTRSQRVWSKVMDRFSGRDAMNTLLCVLYSPIAVSTLVRAAHDDKEEFPGHIMVLRLGGIFIILMTDSNTNARFSLDWYLRRGEHTSAFIWLNIKESCWHRHRDVLSAMPSVDASGLVVNTENVTQNTEKYETLSKVSEVTMAGIHFLKFLRTKAEDLSKVAAINATFCSHMYIQPYTRSTTGKSFKRGGATPVSDKWCVDMDKFVSLFAVRGKNRVLAHIPTVNAVGSGMVVDGGGGFMGPASYLCEKVPDLGIEQVPVDATGLMAGQVFESAISQTFKPVDIDMHVNVEVIDVIEHLTSWVELQDEKTESVTITGTQVGPESRGGDESHTGGVVASAGVSDQVQGPEQPTEQENKQDDVTQDMKSVSVDETHIFDVAAFTGSVMPLGVGQGSLLDDEVSYSDYNYPCEVVQQEHDTVNDSGHADAVAMGGVVTQQSVLRDEDESWLSVLRDEEGGGVVV